MEEAQGRKHAERETHEESAKITTSEDLSDDVDDAALSSDYIVVMDWSFDSANYIAEFIDGNDEEILDGRDGNSGCGLGDAEWNQILDRKTIRSMQRRLSK